MRVILSGGGTGGHIYPALAVAGALKARSETIEILFVGAHGRMEMEKVPAHGYQIEALPIAGLRRSLSLSNLKVPFLLAKSLGRAAQIIKKFQPQAVAGFGGYASAPILRMAQRSGIPTLIQEQNSYAGLTNKWLAKRADIICTAYDNMDDYFPVEKIRKTGNPVRQDLKELQYRHPEALTHFGGTQYKKTVLLFGGSLGAKTLNEAMRLSTEYIDRQSDVLYLWQTGKSYLDDYTQTSTAALTNVRIMPFIRRMDLAYALSDIVICRAGALSISELALVERPAVLVPSPHVAEDHQTHNAKAMVQKGAAWMIKDADASELLIPYATERLKDENAMQQMKLRLRAQARPDAADEIANCLLSLASAQQA